MSPGARINTPDYPVWRPRETDPVRSRCTYSAVDTQRQSGSHMSQHRTLTCSTQQRSLVQINSEKFHGCYGKKSNECHGRGIRDPPHTHTYTYQPCMLDHTCTRFWSKLRGIRGGRVPWMSPSWHSLEFSSSHIDLSKSAPTRSRYGVGQRGSVRSGLAWKTACPMQLNHPVCWIVLTPAAECTNN